MQILQVNYQDPAQMAEFMMILNAYALDPMGGGQPLSEETLKNLPGELSKRPGVHSLMAYVDQKPVGLVNLVEGFSTFAAKPLLNVHDAIVLKGYRRRGIMSALLKAAQDLALSQGACKLTLEVLSANSGAIKAYHKFGFGSYELDPQFGHALFLDKKLTP